VASEPLDAATAYQLALLESIGSLPRFDACVLCGREEELTHFSSFEGGLICRHCEAGQVEKREISAATVKTLQESLFPEDHCSQSSGTRAGAFTVLNYHISHLMGREPTLGATLVPKSVQRIVE